MDAPKLNLHHQDYTQICRQSYWLGFLPCSWQVICDPSLKDMTWSLFGTMVHQYKRCPQGWFFNTQLFTLLPQWFDKGQLCSVCHHPFVFTPHNLAGSKQQHRGGIIQLNEFLVSEVSDAFNLSMEPFTLCQSLYGYLHKTHRQSPQ